MNTLFPRTTVVVCREGVRSSHQILARCKGFIPWNYIRIYHRKGETSTTRRVPTLVTMPSPPCSSTLSQLDKRHRLIGRSYIRVYTCIYVRCKCITLPRHETHITSHSKMRAHACQTRRLQKKKKPHDEKAQQPLFIRVYNSERYHVSNWLRDARGEAQGGLYKLGDTNSPTSIFQTIQNYDVHEFRGELFRVWCRCQGRQASPIDAPHHPRKQLLFFVVNQ
jgi:hypothetical protein